MCAGFTRRYVKVKKLDGTKSALTSSSNHNIACHLADAFIQSDLQLIRLSRRHTPWSNVGLRALLKGQQLCRSDRGQTGDRTADLAAPSQVA